MSSCQPAYVRFEKDEYNVSETTEIKTQTAPPSVPPAAVPLSVNPYAQSES